MAMLGGIVLLGAIFGSLLGCRRGSNLIDSPSEQGDYPTGMNYQEHVRMLQERYRKHRVMLTVGGALAGGPAPPSLCSWRLRFCGVDFFKKCVPS